MPQEPEASKISIAKIGAAQAIAVALITATAGVFAGYLARGASDNPQAHIQRWISIEGIEIENHTLIRLVATVNGVNYSYPSKAVWAQVGENRERFPLPATSETYRVSFQAFLSDPGNVPTTQAGSQFVDEINVSKLPVTEKSYTLFTVGGMSTVYGTQDRSVQVRYSIK